MDACMHTICQRIKALANAVAESKITELIHKTEHLGALAVQSQAEAFRRYVTLHANLRNVIEFDHDCIEVQNSVVEELKDEVRDLRLERTAWCISKDLAPTRCATLLQAGNFCRNAPLEHSYHCEEHASHSDQCLYGVQLDEDDGYKWKLQCHRSVAIGASGVPHEFCAIHMSEFDRQCKDVSETLEQTEASLQLTLDQVKYFFRQNPLSRPVDKSEIPANENCVICLEPLDAPADNHQTHKLLCGHFFHGGDIESDACLAGFFKTADEYRTFTNSTCPLCRWPVFANGQLCNERPQIAHKIAEASTDVQASADETVYSPEVGIGEDGGSSTTGHETDSSEHSSESGDDEMTSEYVPSDEEDAVPDADDEQSENEGPVHEETMTDDLGFSPTEDVDETINRMIAGAIDDFLVDAGEFADMEDSDVEMMG